MKIIVYGNIDILDKETFKKLHTVTAKTWIEINEEEGEDEWTAMNKASDLWLHMFDAFGLVEIDEVWT